MIWPILYASISYGPYYIDTCSRLRQLSEKKVNKPIAIGFVDVRRQIIVKHGGGIQTIDEIKRCDWLSGESGGDKLTMDENDVL